MSPAGLLRVTHGPTKRKVLVTRSPNVRGLGHGSVKTGALEPGVIRRVRPIGFGPVEDWGEAAWTAADLR